MCCNKKEESNDFHIFSMLLPLFMGLITPNNQAQTIINIYSDGNIKVSKND
jgi:hypothetical protein